MSDDLNARLHLETTSDTKGIKAAIKELRETESILARINKLGLASVSKKVSESLGNNGAAAAFARRQRSEMADLRARFSFEGLMQRQRAAKEKAAAEESKLFHDADLRRVRERMNATSTLARQRVAAARETERAETQAFRSSLRAVHETMSVTGEMDRQRRREEAAAVAAAEKVANARTKAAREAARAEEQAARQSAAAWSRAHSDIGRAMSRGRTAFNDVVRPVGTAAIAGAAGTAAVARKALRVEGDVDAAEINTRIYGGLDKAAARTLRDKWAAPLSEQLGIGADKLLNSWTDALKLGIPAAGAGRIAELATKTSEAWGVPFERVSDSLGLVNQILTSTGTAFDFERIKSVANTVQFLAAKQATTPEKMLSFLQRGAGAAQVLGMSQEAGAAFGSASTSLGNQAGKSGRMFDYVASRLVELPRLTRKHGDEGRQARQMLSALGYSGAEDVERRRRADPDAFLPDFMNRFARIRDAKKQDQALRFFAGREWLGEFGRMVKGIDTYKDAVELTKQAKSFDAIGAVWDLHRTKLSFVFKQFKAGWTNILGEIGKELSPLAREAGDFWLGWTGKLRDGGLSARVKAAMTGFVNGLGFGDFKQLLAGTFGNPGEGSAGSIASWSAAAKGFASGLRDVGSVIGTVFRAMSGGSDDPETLGRLAGRIGALSGALVVMSPILGVLGGLASGITAIGLGASAAMAAYKSLGVSGIVSRIAGGGIGLALSRVFSLGLVAEIGAHRGEIATLMLSGIGTIVDVVKSALSTGFEEMRSWVRKNLSLKGIVSGIVSEATPAPVDRWLKAPSGAIVNGGRPNGQSNPTDLLPGLGAHATGGFIRGAGGPRSDSILARLSNGEFVVNAAAASRHRGLLEAINGAPGYATGGFIGDQPPHVFSRTGWGSGANDNKALVEAIQALIREMRWSRRDLGDGALRDRINHALGTGIAPSSASVAHLAGLGQASAGLGGGIPYTSGAGGAALSSGTPGQSFSTPGVGARYGMGGSPVTAGPPVPMTGSGATVAKGSLSSNQQEAYRSARAEGLSDKAARALVANMSGESLRNPRDHHWDVKHMSQGIVQWDPQRAGAIQNKFGKLPRDMTVAEQTRAAIWEIRSQKRFARTKAALEGDHEGAMLDALVRNYEAPAEPGKAIAERSRYYRGFKPNASAATVFDGKALAEAAGIALGKGIVKPSKDVGDGMKSTGFHRANAADLAQEAPHERLAREAPGRSSPGAGSGGGTTHAPITINTYGQDPETTAAAVQRHLTETNRYSTQDSGFESI